MSWDISMEYETCLSCGQGGSHEVRNVTYNNSEIFSVLGVHPKDLEGKYGMEVSEKIGKAYNDSFGSEMIQKLKPLEPENKWGGIEDSRDFLAKLHRACLEHPKAKVRVS